MSDEIYILTANFNFDGEFTSEDFHTPVVFSSFEKAKAYAEKDAGEELSFSEPYGLTGEKMLLAKCTRRRKLAEKLSMKPRYCAYLIIETEIDKYDG